VADAALEGLRARLHGDVPKNTALPTEEVALLNDAAKAWKAIPEADFWAALAAVSRPAPNASPEAFLREQTAWMGLVAELSLADLTSPLAIPGGRADPPWTWNSAAEKADLVDTLVAAAAGSPTPVTAVLRRLRTLQRGADPLPRAIAAELAQLALAALDGVKPAPDLDRKRVVQLKERPPGPNATAQEQDEHRDRETLRTAAHSLVMVDTGYSQLDADLFRNKLSRLYREHREILRQYRPAKPNDENDPPGEERYRRLTEVVGPLDGAVIEALDKWSAAIASGSTDPAGYVDKAREVEAALQGLAAAGHRDAGPRPTARSCSTARPARR
jgi:hypothetical protein